MQHFTIPTFATKLVKNCLYYEKLLLSVVIRYYWNFRRECTDEERLVCGNEEQPVVY